MKFGFLAIALTIGLLTAGMAGDVLAGDMGASAVDPEANPNMVWAAQGPIETGALPGASAVGSEGERMDSSDTAFPEIEVGGVRYRAGIDVGA